MLHLPVVAKGKCQTGELEQRVPGDEVSCLQGRYGEGGPGRVWVKLASDMIFVKTFMRPELLGNFFLAKST